MSSLDSSSEEEVDFDQYRKEYESEEHWKLRKSFMETFWDEFETEEEVLCNAQLFVNIEFLGCKYSREVMERIESMAQRVSAITAYRKSRKNSLKRCFVQAQDAVAAKYQKKNEPMKFISFVKQESNTKTSNMNVSNEVKFNVNEVNFSNVSNIPNHGFSNKWSVKQCQEKIVSKSIRYEYDGINASKILDSDEEKEMKKQSGWDDEDREFFDKSGNKQKPIIRFTNTQKLENLRSLLKDVILFDNGDDSDTNWTLNKTIAMMNKVGKVQMMYNADSRQYLYVYNDHIIGEGTGDSKKAAKKAADEDFIKTLKENCYTIRSKLKYFSIESVIKKNNNSNAPCNVSRDDQKLQENNLGFKMLKSLGWKGGSLGSKGSDGIIDPINLEIRIGRLGLGSDIDKFDLGYFRNLLKNFQNQNLEYDLVFSSDFSKEERAKIHQVAAQLNLKTKSYGKKEERHLVISTKISPQILRQKLLEGDKYLREKYDIFPPRSQTS